METKIDEISDRIYRIATFIPGVAGVGLTFNQFLIDADEPLLFHTGQRALFPSVSAAVARIVELERLRWITFSHVESDECGSMNEWLAAASNATAAHGRIGCNIWLNDSAIRPPRALADAERVDLGGKVVRRIDTPHLPHCWDAGLLFEETTRTLFTSDLFTQLGEPAAVTDHDIAGVAVEVEKILPFTSLTPAAAPTVRKLAALAPRTLAIMHGSSFSGDGAAMLSRLADHYEQQLRGAVAG
ncbi:MAG: MBL fold metallo-hydrolase [Candidatus Binataceae bacterium]